MHWALAGSRVTRTFRALRHRNYRFLWVNTLTVGVGYMVMLTARRWLVLQLTDSAFWLGMIDFCGSFPMFFLSPLGGIYADRIDRRKLLIIGGGSDTLLLLLLATLTITGLITIWHIAIIALLSGVIWAMCDPSYMALMPNLVTPDDLMNAIALNETAWNISSFAGPALAGVLIGLVDIGGCFYFAGISCTVAVAVLFLIAYTPSTRATAGRATMWQDLKEGVGYIGSNRTVLMLMLMVAVLSLIILPYTVLVPVFARDILGVGVYGYSQLMAATGAGALLGALTVASLGNFRRKGWLLVISALMFSVTVIVFATSKWFLFSLALVAAAAAIITVFFTTAETLIQSTIPDEVRGRVMGLYTLTWTVTSIGSMVAGAAADRIGAPITLMIGGFISMLFILGIIMRLPSLRRL